MKCDEFLPEWTSALADTRAVLAMLATYGILKLNRSKAHASKKIENAKDYLMTINKMTLGVAGDVQQICTDMANYVAPKGMKPQKSAKRS